jgi:hypothetical protein
VLEIEPARYCVRVIKRENLAGHKCPEAELSRLRPAPKIVEKGKLSDAVDRRCAHQEISYSPHGGRNVDIF